MCSNTSTPDAYRAFFENHADAVLLLASDGTVRAANSAACIMFGMTEAQWCAVEGSFLQGCALPGVTMPLQETGGGSVRVTLPGKDGSTFRAEVTATRGYEGATFLVIRSTTSEAAQKAPQQETGCQDEFLAMLFHELRNPLAPLQSSIYLLRHGSPDTEGAQRALKVIERQTKYLTTLVNDLLDLTRIARGGVELRRAPVDLREVVQGVVEDFGTLMTDSDISIRVVLPEAPVSVVADETRIVQILGNLLHNASKFTHRGGAVTVRLTTSGATAEISVADNGRGIGQALLPEIFKTFVKGEATAARCGEGLGVGLALVQALTELHGGSVQAASPGEGKGAVFTVSLPLAAGACPANGPAAQRSKSGGEHILIVDDHPDAADSLAEILRTLGHEVEVAYDGPSAVERVRSNPPSILLCDIGLPGMSGYEVARTVRNDRGEQLILVALTGYATQEDVLEAVGAGFDGHLSKPVQVTRLLKLFDELRSKRADRQ